MTITSKMAVISSVDSCYAGLLGLAEGFRTSNPPRIKECIQCLTAIFQFNPPPAIQAKTHLQIGRILQACTNNEDLARTNLEKAMLLSQTLGPGSEQITFEAASILATIYKEQSQYPLSKQVLRQALEITSSENIYFWQFKLFFQLAEVHACDNELTTAVEVLEMGERIADQSGSQYMRCLFTLSKALIFLLIKDVNRVLSILTATGNFLERWQGQSYQRESLVVFYLLLKVWQLLAAGQAKTVRPFLKELQQSIQNLTTMSFDETKVHEAEQFEWLPKEQLCVLVYLVTVMHSMYAGYMDKVLKYSAKALSQVERLKAVSAGSLISIFQLMLLEHTIMCRVVQGQPANAIKEISQIYQTLKMEPKLIKAHKPVLHTLLGLYAMSMNLMEHATTQFNIAFKTCVQPELANFIGLNLAIIYIRAGESKQRELASLMSQIHPANMTVNSHSLQAGYYYVSALRAFFETRAQDAKKYLRETLKIANAEDLNRLTACSLVLLGHTFLASGNPQEALNMVLPAIQLSGKIPDNYVQLWAAGLLRDLYGMLGSPVQSSEGFHKHHGITKQLIENHMQARKMPEHGLVEWTGTVSPKKLIEPQQQQQQQHHPLPQQQQPGSPFLASFSQAGPSGLS